MELFFATHNLQVGQREKWTEGTDFVASDVVADERVLLKALLYGDVDSGKL